jgi:hypothetical protein
MVQPESFTITPEERRMIVRVACDTSAGRVPVLPGNAQGNVIEMYERLGLTPRSYILMRCSIRESSSWILSQSTSASLRYGALAPARVI